MIEEATLQLALLLHVVLQSKSMERMTEQRLYLGVLHEFIQQFAESAILSILLFILLRGGLAIGTLQQLRSQRAVVRLHLQMLQLGDE